MDLYANAQYLNINVRWFEGSGLKKKRVYKDAVSKCPLLNGLHKKIEFLSSDDLY